MTPYTHLTEHLELPMYYWLLLLLVLLCSIFFYQIVFLFFDKHNDIKRSFGIPFFYSVVNHDLGKKPNRFYIRYANLVGTPDVIFKLFLVPYYIVGEAKSRTLHINHVNKESPLLLREEYQLMLYIGILKYKHPFSRVSGKFRFKNVAYPLEFDKKTFKYVFKHRKEALRAINCLR